MTTRSGKGRLCLYTATAPFPHEHLLETVERYTPRDVVVDEGRFRVVLRESDEHLYAFVVNPDLYETHEDAITLAGSYAGCVDLGCAAAFPVKTDADGERTRFHLRLTPGEGTVVRLTR